MDSRLHGLAEELDAGHDILAKQVEAWAKERHVEAPWSRPARWWRG